MKDGIDRLYHGNGNIRHETPYRQGKIHGVEKYYYNNGKLHYEIPSRQGKIHGMVKCYSISGELSDKSYCLYGELVSKDTYRKHELMERLSGL